jgi:MFS family permease
MVLGSFAWSFVYVSLPFYVDRLSAGDPIASLRWTGWILGVTPLVTVVMAPVWGRLAEQRDPKRFYVMAQLLQGVIFFSMIFARSLPELFATRVALGLVGASSTFVFIMAGRGRDRESVGREIASVQSMMTVGQVVGPLVGALAAASVGFRGSFAVGASILVASAALVHWGAESLPPAGARAASADRRVGWRKIGAVSVVVLGGSIQVLFLPSVLPQVLPSLGVGTDDTLVVGGVLVFLSGVAAAVGSWVAPRLVGIVSERATIAWLLLASSGFLAGFSLLTSVPAYGVARFIQVLCVAPLFPLIVSSIAAQASGPAIGVINSARIGASFLGPILATTVLSWGSPAALYVVLALIGLVCAPFAFVRARAAGRA